MYTSCWIGISIQISTSLCRFYKQFLTSLYRSALLGIYGKFHVIIFLSHILRCLFPSIDFYIAKKIFERTNYENKFLRELPLFNLQIFRWCIKICIRSYFNKINTFQHIGIKFNLKRIISSNVYIVSNRNFHSASSFLVLWQQSI
jgi:hypothetical protein